jgi:hypothetical protein
MTDRPMGYQAASTMRVVRRVGSRVEELTPSSLGWSRFDMHPPGTPDAVGDPMGYEGGGTARVVFRGVDNHIHEISLGPNGWGHFDMHPPGTPDAVGDPMGYEGGGTARVVYAFSNGSAAPGVFCLSLIGGWTGQVLTGWNPDHGPLVSNPCVIGVEAGKRQIYLQGVDGALWCRNFNGTWDDWSSLGGNITSAPTAVSSAPGRTDVFARGDAGQLRHVTLSVSTTWEDLGGSLLSPPTAVTDPHGNIDVYCRTTDLSVIHRRLQGSWSAWDDLGGQLLGDPAAASDGTSTLLLARGPSGQYVACRPGVTGWEATPFASASDPVAIRAYSGKLSFAYSTGSNINQIDYDLAAGSWSGPTNIGEHAPVAQLAMAAPGHVHPAVMGNTFCDRQYAGCCDEAEETEDPVERSIKFAWCKAQQLACYTGKTIADAAKELNDKLVAIGDWIAANATTIAIVVGAILVIGAIVVCIFCPPAALAGFIVVVAF